jgi:hypothetical protein
LFRPCLLPRKRISIYYLRGDVGLKYQVFGCGTNPILNTWKMDNRLGWIKIRKKLWTHKALFYHGLPPEQGICTKSL